MQEKDSCLLLYNIGPVIDLLEREKAEAIDIDEIIQIRQVQQGM
jgi:hypothetical protein